MILNTKNQAEIAPVITEETLPVDSGWVADSPVVGNFTTYEDRTQPSYHNDYRVTVDSETTVTNLSADTLDISGFPLVQKVASPAADSGTLKFDRNGVVIKRSYDISTQSQPQTFRTPVSVSSGTLLKHCHDLAFGAATTASKDDYYFRTVGGAESSITNGINLATVEPNPDCWAAAWDFSGVAIVNKSSASATSTAQRAGVAITKRHVAQAYHFCTGVGTVFYFMLPDGSTVSRTSIGVNSRPAGADNTETQWLNEIPGDIRIHTLDSDLPAGVAVYAIAGTWAQKNASAGSPSTTYPWQTPTDYDSPVVCLYLDQTRKAKYLGSYAIDCATSSYAVSSITWSGSSISLTLAEMRFTGSGIDSDFKTALGARHAVGASGDSGSPLFVPLTSTTLALLTCFTSPQSGPWYGEGRLNALIASADSAAGVSTGYTVTVAADPTA